MKSNLHFRKNIKDVLNDICKIVKHINNYKIAIVYNDESYEKLNKLYESIIFDCVFHGRNYVKIDSIKILLNNNYSIEFSVFEKIPINKKCNWRIDDFNKGIRIANGHYDVEIDNYNVNVFNRITNSRNGQRKDILKRQYAMSGLGQSGLKEDINPIYEEIKKFLDYIMNRNVVDKIFEIRKVVEQQRSTVGELYKTRMNVLERFSIQRHKKHWWKDADNLEASEVIDFLNRSTLGG